MRLTEHLKTLGFSNAQVKQALVTGKVSVSGVPTADGGRLIEPRSVRYNANAPRLTPGRDLVIIHRDEALVVVWKPAGLLSVPARKEGGHKSVIGAVRRLFGAALPVHRIDEQTSGLLIVALDPHTQKQLKDQLFAHSIERRYLALVYGSPNEASWTVENEIVRDRGDGLRGRRTDEDQPAGKNALTHFKKIEQLGSSAALIEATLETGRTHQVRIHLAEGKTPVLGDPLYAHQAAKQGSPRLALHAATLSFTHPRTGKRNRFEAPLADDLEKLRRALIRDEDSKPRPRRKAATSRRGKKTRKKRRR